MYVMGIDGGGTHVRVLITDPALTVYGQAQDAGVNPKVVGYDVSAQRLQGAMRRALAEASIPTNGIAAVCIGLAGGGTDWDPHVIKAVTPHACVVCAGDLKIALVGARGESLGVVVLAGTGSAAYGINAAGDTVFVGGIGYLLDDVGSGYWLGKEAIRHSLRAIDETAPPTRLKDELMAALAITNRTDLVAWMYDAVRENPAAVGQLAPLVLNEAAAGDTVAQTIVEGGAQELALMCRTAMRRLGGMDREHIAFAGGLLTTPNRLSDRLCALLGLSEIPMPRYPPVMGAALLALEALGESS